MLPYKYRSRTFARLPLSLRQVPFQPFRVRYFFRGFQSSAFSIMFCFQLFALALCALPALAAPTPLLQVAKADTPLPGRYIVTLKQESGTSSTASDVKTLSSTMSSSSNITHCWESMGAFAGEFSADDLKMLRSDSRVEAIEEDGVMNALANVTQYVPPCSILFGPYGEHWYSRNSIRVNAPWGLSRISSKTKLASQDDSSLNFTYSFDSTAGAGSTVYIVGGFKFSVIE